MDNPTINTEPVGAEGATSSQDNSGAVETQPAGTDGVVSANESGNEGNAPVYPWENDEKFKGKTPEDIYKSYREMEKTYSRKAEVANLIEEKFGVAPEDLKQLIEAQEEARLEQEYRTNPAGVALREVENLKKQLALQSEEKELDGFLQKNPEYAPFRDKIFKLGLTTEQDKSYEEIADEYFGQARAQGQQDAYRKIEVKKSTQSTSPSQQNPKKFGYGDLKDLPRAERIKQFEAMIAG